eukprot:scaffold336_cov384-Prasinococcus_capsulatus_cf.AAC.22
MQHLANSGRESGSMSLAHLLPAQETVRSPERDELLTTQLYPRCCHTRLVCEPREESRPLGGVRLGEFNCTHAPQCRRWPSANPLRSIGQKDAKRRKTSRLCPRRPVVPNDGRRLKNAGVGLGSVTQRDLKVPRRNAGSPL